MTFYVQIFAQKSAFLNKRLRSKSFFSYIKSNRLFNPYQFYKISNRKPNSLKSSKWAQPSSLFSPLELYNMPTRRARERAIKQNLKVLFKSLCLGDISSLIGRIHRAEEARIGELDGFICPIWGDIVSIEALIIRVEAVEIRFDEKLWRVI